MLKNQNYVLKIFKPIYDYFNENIYDISFFDFNNVYCTDDISNDVFYFCNPMQNECIGEMEAVTIPENNVSNNPIILIDITSNDLYSFANAIIHEFIHIYDYSIFSNMFLNDMYKNITKHKYYYTYKNISEMHAFSICEYHAAKYNDIFFNVNSTDKFMKDVFLNNFSDILQKECKKVEQYGCEIYYLMKTFGRIYLLDKYNNINDFSNSYVHKFLPMLIHDNIYHNLSYYLYQPMVKFLQGHRDISEIEYIQKVIHNLIPVSQ